MMATCRPEAMGHCHVLPGQPVCPMKLAKCLSQGLAKHADQISPMCTAAVKNIEEFMKKPPAEHRQEHARQEAHPEHARQEAHPEKEMAPEAVEVAVSPAQPHHSHHGVHCYLHRVWHYLTNEGTFFTAILAGIVASMGFWMLLVAVVGFIKCCCCRRFTRYEAEGRYVVIDTSELAPLGYVTKQGTSELQV